jgi:acetyltransferase-like isoleucine patch superfamily enzyme
MFDVILSKIINKIAFTAPGGGNFRPWLQRQRGVHIGKNAWISQYVYFDELRPDLITIGDNCTIGLRVSIFTHFYWGRKRDTGYSGSVVIGKDVFIGPYCVLLPNVHIGDGSVIKAGTVVTRHVPSNTYWGTCEAGPLAHVTIPLTSEYNYIDFVHGLRAVERKKGEPK